MHPFINARGRLLLRGSGPELGSGIQSRMRLDRYMQLQEQWELGPENHETDWVLHYVDLGVVLREVTGESGWLNGSS